MRSCLYRGHVHHRRLSPIGHEFTYPLFLLYLDLSELDAVFRTTRLLSDRRFSWGQFRRSDHLGDPEMPLDLAVRQVLQEQLQRELTGPICLLTHLRYFGYYMNPLSLYYCFDELGQELEAVVAEVNNTPWGEQHVYTLDLRNAASSPIQHRKEFHVSPFMGMDMDYRWSLTTPGEDLMVHLENLTPEGKLFEATLQLQRRPLTAGQVYRMLCAFSPDDWQSPDRDLLAGIETLVEGMPVSPASPHHSNP